MYNDHLKFQKLTKQVMFLDIHVDCSYSVQKPQVLTVCMSVTCTFNVRHSGYPLSKAVNQWYVFKQQSASIKPWHCLNWQIILCLPKY